MLFQIYDYYRTVYGSEKGQDLIEYALLLALIVAVGMLIYQTSGLKDSLVTIFTNANTVANTAASVSTGKQEHCPYQAIGTDRKHLPRQVLSGKGSRNLLFFPESGIGWI